MSGGHDPNEGPKTLQWLVGRHLDRVLESLARPLHDPDINKETWQASIGYQVYAFRRVVQHLDPDGPTPFDLDDDGETDGIDGWDVEDYLDELGEIVTLLNKTGVLSKTKVPSVDAREWFKSMAEEKFNGNGAAVKVEV